MNDVKDLVDKLAEKLHGKSKDGECDWCGKDTTGKKNMKLYKLPWHGKRGGDVSLCSYCRSHVEKAHVGLPITNPNHSRFGQPMSRIDVCFINDNSIMNFDGAEELLAKAMVTKMHLPLKNMEAA